MFLKSSLNQKISSFESIADYPELKKVQKHWKVILAEAIKAIPAMRSLRDWRADESEWKVFPLLSEEEDKGVFPEEYIEECRKLASRTVSIVEDAVPNLQGFAFSLVNPLGKIRPHQHRNPFVSASLCLLDGGNTKVVVAQEAKTLQPGELVIFDYRKPHAVYNYGSQIRIALIIALPKKAKD